MGINKNIADKSSIKSLILKPYIYTLLMNSNKQKLKKIKDIVENIKIREEPLDSVIGNIIIAR